jgi:hypothetical protein
MISCDGIFSSKGDSGSAVYYMHGWEMLIVGLLLGTSNLSKFIIIIFLISLLLLLMITKGPIHFQMFFQYLLANELITSSLSKDVIDYQRWQYQL